MSITPDYAAKFARCGRDVVIDDCVYIEHPELFSVGDNVRFDRGFYCQDAPQVTLGSDVRFYPGCFVQGNGELTVGSRVTFYPNTYMSVGSEKGFIRIGDRSHFAPGCALYGSGGLTVGAHCNVAAHVVLATAQHDPTIHDKPMALMPGRGGPITISEDVWLGANVTITPNTAIARGCIIAANAVATRDTTPFGMYRGVPARWYQNRPEQQGEASP